MPRSTYDENNHGRRAWWWVAGVALLLAAVVAGVWWLVVARHDEPVAGVEPSPTATVEPTVTPESSPPPSTLTPTSAQSAEPTPEEEPGALAGATFGPFSGAPRDAGSAGSWIADVRSAGHVGYDRVVVEFDGGYVPTYEVAYTPTSGPFFDIPGNVVPLQGSAFIDIWLQGTSRVDMADDYEPVYTGPNRVRSDTVVVTEVVETEDFEANVHWIIGLNHRTPFVVRTLSSPSRLVIDIAH